MQHTIEEQSGTRVVRLRGPIDVSQALELRELLGRQIDGAGVRVLADLSEVTLIDSSGVGLFVAMHRKAEAAGAAFALAGASAPVGRVFELTRTNKLLRIFPSSEQGLDTPWDE